MNSQSQYSLFFVIFRYSSLNLHPFERDMGTEAKTKGLSPILGFSPRLETVPWFCQAMDHHVPQLCASPWAREWKREVEFNSSNKIPTATEPDECTVWYKVVGDKGYGDSVAKSVKATIKV